MARNKMKKQQKIPMKKKRKHGPKFGNPNRWRAPFPMERVYIERKRSQTQVHLNSVKGFASITFHSKSALSYEVIDDGNYYYKTEIIGENIEERIRNHIRRCDWMSKQQKQDFYTAIDEYYGKHFEKHFKWLSKKKRKSEH